MSEDVWSAQDTTPDAVEAALRDLLRKRHAADQALAPTRVLNLIVVVDCEWKEEISNRLQNVGRYHASRTILCSVEPGRTTLDAVAAVTYEDGGGPGVHPMRERVQLDLGPEHLSRLDTVVDPIVVEELPTMLWSPHGHADAVDSLLALIDVILIDSDEVDVCGGLPKAADLCDGAYVVDLAWLRTTPWRERLAASFDSPHRRSALEQLTDICVRHRPSSQASAALLVGWLSARLQWETAPLDRDGHDGRRGSVRSAGENRKVDITLAPYDLEVPGLAGVTVGWDGGCSLSLDRGQGGLTAHERNAQGREWTWRILGASRGEGLILGEGVRQALLRDATYEQALESAMVLCEAAR